MDNIIKCLTDLKEKYIQTIDSAIQELNSYKQNPINIISNFNRNIFEGNNTRLYFQNYKNLEDDILTYLKEICPLKKYDIKFYNCCGINDFTIMISNPNNKNEYMLKVNLGNKIYSFSNIIPTKYLPKKPTEYEYKILPIIKQYMSKPSVFNRIKLTKCIMGFDTKRKSIFKNVIRVFDILSIRKNTLMKACEDTRYKVETYQEQINKVETKYNNDMNKYEKCVQEAKEITDWLDSYGYKRRNYN